jgi:hypothetical protein
MAFACPVGFDVERMRSQVRATYERVARDPGGEFHFHRGLRYAVDFLHYDEAELEFLPTSCTARFAGVGNPLRIGPIATGETVLDHACGGGMDLLLAARRTGPLGRCCRRVERPGVWPPSSFCSPRASAWSASSHFGTPTLPMFTEAASAIGRLK